MSQGPILFPTEKSFPENLHICLLSVSVFDVVTFVNFSIDAGIENHKLSELNEIFLSVQHILNSTIAAYTSAPRPIITISIPQNQNRN